MTLIWKSTTDQLYAVGNSSPSLDLDFATNKTLNDNISGDNLITFSRNSIGTYVDSSGVIQTAAVDAPRFDHDPETGESLGLLIEESRTNSCAYSEEFTTNWTAVNATVVPSSTTAPDGTLTGSKLAIDSTNNAHYLELADVSNSVPRIVSVFAKSAEHSIISLGTSFNQTGPYRSIDLATGESKQAGGNVGAWGIEDYGNGWKRVWFEVLEPSTSRDNFYIGVVSSAGPTYRITDPWQGTSGEGLYIWGAQIEEGSFPTSYIPTSGSAVTRAADEATITGSNFSGWYNQSEGTVFTDYNTFDTGSGRYPTAYEFNDGTSLPSGPQLTPSYNASITRLSSPVDGVYTNANLDLTLSSKGKIAFTFSSGYIAGSLDGGGVLTNTSGLDPDVVKLYIGRPRIGNAALNGHISRLTYWPYRLPNATLQTITGA